MPRLKTLPLEKKSYPRRSLKWVEENVNWKYVDFLLERHLRLEDICDFFNVGPQIMRRAFKKFKKETFDSYADKKRVAGRITIMRKYWQKVDEGQIAAILFGMKAILKFDENAGSSSEQSGFQFVRK